MPSIVVVPLDGSDFAEQALPIAVTLAHRLDAELNLALVRPSLPLEAVPTRGAEYLQQVAGRIDADMPRRISHTVLVDELGPLSDELPAADTIASLLAGHAANAEATLVVMTTRARAGLARAWLGSVADTLIRRAACPILAIRPDEDAAPAVLRAQHRLRHVLVPLDGSDAAEQAVPAALLVGAPFGARYTLLRVVSPLTWEATPHVHSATPPDALGLSREAAVAALEQTAEGMRQAGADVAVETVMAASPGAAIVDYAAEHTADLIAISTSGAGGVRRQLLGSTADEVVRNATVPALICNATRPESG